MTKGDFLVGLCCLLPPEGKPDGRMVFAKSTGSPSGIPISSPDGAHTFFVCSSGLLVRSPGKTILIPYCAIAELYVEDGPREDDIEII